MYWDEISFAKTFHSAKKLVLAKRSVFFNAKIRNDFWDYKISFARAFHSAKKLLILAKRSGFANKNMMYPNKITS
jgi:hypothetical protein